MTTFISATDVYCIPSISITEDFMFNEQKQSPELSYPFLI